MSLRYEEDLPPLLVSALSNDGVGNLLEVLKVNDEEAYLHSKEVGRLVAMCLEEMNALGDSEYCAEEEIEIVKGGLLSDIGKAFLPLGIQHSKIRLDDYLTQVVKMHPTLGYIVVRDGMHSKIVKDIVLMHHANADGSGYPFNVETKEPFTEKNVPGYVWIVGYADRFDAMTGTRKFKNSLSYHEAWEEINRMRREGILPYRYAKYYHNVIKSLDIFT